MIILFGFIVFFSLLQITLGLFSNEISRSKSDNFSATTMDNSKKTSSAKKNLL